MKRLDELERRRIALEIASKHADAAVESAEHQLHLALAGLSLERWQTLVGGQASIRSARAGRDANLAARRRSAVEAALQDLASTKRTSAVRIAEALAALGEAVNAAACGKSGPHVVHRMANRPGPQLTTRSPYGYMRPSRRSS